MIRFRLVPLLLLLTTPLIAQSDPRAVVRDLLIAEASGDAHRAAALWLSPKTALSPAAIRQMQHRCARLADVSFQTVTESGSEVTLNTREATAIEGIAPAKFVRVEISHSRFVVKKSRGDWRIVRRESREEALVEQLAAAKNESEINALLGGAEELQSETLVRLIAARIPPLVNRNASQQAGDLLHAAITIAEKLGDPRSLAEVLSARSIVVRHAPGADAELGVELSQQAVAFAEAAGDADTLARTLFRLARANEERDQNIDIVSLQAALQVADQLAGDPGIAALTAMHLSRGFEALGRRREAFTFAVQAEKFARDSNEASAKISALHMLGSAYMWVGGTSMASRYFRQAADLAAASGNEQMAAFSTASLAGAQAVEGKLKESFRTVDDALKRFSESASAELYRRREWRLRDFGRYDEAERDLRHAISLDGNEPPNPWRDARDLAFIRLGQKRYEEALAFAEQAESGGDDLRLLAREIHAAALHCLGRDDEALAELEEMAAERNVAPSAISDPQRSIFVGSGTTPGDAQLIELTVAHGNPLRALEVAEAAKAEWLAGALANHGVESVEITKREDRELERQLELRVRELNRKLVSGNHTAADAADLRHQLTEARLDLVDFRSKALAGEPLMYGRIHSPLNLDDLPKRLDDVTIISFSETKEWYFAFIVSPKRGSHRVVTARIIPMAARDLKRKVARYADLVAQRNLRVSASGAELYALLIKSLGPAVRDARLLCIIPDGALWRVPFHALGPANGKPLAERVPIFYAPSIPVLAAAEARHDLHPHDGKQSLLAFANPVVSAKTAALYRAFDPEAPLGSIPETETEVQRIAEIYGKERSRIHSGADALESMMKREAPRYDVLHIATHGIAQPNLPMFSAVLLAAKEKDSEEDGVLEAREIVGLHLDADLTVLSACDTGNAAILGSGIVSLSWAFLAAGCPTTVVSQWKAQSAATTTLMIEFHRQLSLGLTKPEALRNAQRKLRSDPRYRHPFYWAPFVVIGAP